MAEPTCPLCGHRLQRPWDHKFYCSPHSGGCGTWIEQEDVVKLVDPEPTLWDVVEAEVGEMYGLAPVLEGPGQVRNTDPDTSALAAKMITAKATSARVLLLAAFYRWRDADGLTDEQAARNAGISLASEYATRCSELRRGGLIEPTGATRTGASGASREVSRITALGELVMERRG